MLLEFENGDDVRYVELRWSEPVAIDDADEELEDDHAFLYMLLAQARGAPKLLYIGRVFDQHVADRLWNQDHLDRQDEMQADHPRHELMVSVGDVVDSDWARLHRNRVDDLETLLIYVNDPPYNRNKKGMFQMPWYRIYNSGEGEPLLETAYYGPAWSSE